MTTARILLLGCTLWLCGCSKSVMDYPEMTWNKAIQPGIPREVRSTMLQELRVPARLRGLVAFISEPAPRCFAAPCNFQGKFGHFVKLVTGETVRLASRKVKVDDLEQSRTYVLGGELVYLPEKFERLVGGDVPDGTVVDWNSTNFMLSVDVAQSE